MHMHMGMHIIMVIAVLTQVMTVAPSKLEFFVSYQRSKVLSSKK